MAAEPMFYRVFLHGPDGLPWAYVYGVAHSKAEAEAKARKKYAHWPEAETLVAEVSTMHEVEFMPDTKPVTRGAPHGVDDTKKPGRQQKPARG